MLSQPAKRPIVGCQTQLITYSGKQIGNWNLRPADPTQESVGKYLSRPGDTYRQGVAFAVATSMMDISAPCRMARNNQICHSI